MKKILLLAAFSLLAVACDKDNKNIFENAKEAAKDTGLQGEGFQSPKCANEGEEALANIFKGIWKDAVVSSRTEIKVEGANVTRRKFMYNQLDCQGEAYTYEETGTMTIHEDQKMADESVAIDFVFNKVTLQMDSEEGVTAANQRVGGSLCGIQWSKGEPKDITDKAGDLTCYTGTVPRTNYNVYRVDADKQLILGASIDSNSQDRPTQADDTYTYITK